LKRFCVKCGVEESPSTPIVNGLCPKCYVEVRGVVEKVDKIEIEFCRSCGAVNVHGKWIDVNSSENLSEIVEEYVIDSIKPLQDFLLEDVKVDFKPFEDSIATIKLFGKLRETKIEHAIQVRMSWKSTLCPNCRRIAGGGHKAVVQIRYVNDDEEIEKFVKLVEKEFNKFIKEIKPVKKGYDIMLTDAGIAKKIADLAKRRWFGVKIIESFGDVKRLSTGEKMARLYISIRILNFKSGDYIVVNGTPYTVESFDGAWLKLRNQNGDVIEVHVDFVMKSFSKYKSRK